MRLALSDCKINRSPHLPARILKVSSYINCTSVKNNNNAKFEKLQKKIYLEASIGFRRIFISDGLHTTLLSEVCICHNGSCWRALRGMCTPRIGTSWGVSECLEAAQESTCSPVFSILSSAHTQRNTVIGIEEKGRC